MIYKIDHLAYGSDDFPRDGALLAASGYAETFCERGVENMVSTKGVMRSPSDRFDIALYEKPGALGVELLNYGRLHQAGPGRFHAGRGNGSPLEDFLALGPAGSLRLRLASVDSEASVRFWELLRFKAADTGGDGPRLVFASLFGGPETVLDIAPAQRHEPASHIDEAGFSVLAFIADSAHKERANFVRHGHAPTVVSPLRVNGQDLEIFFVRGPEGAVAEVISLRRKPRP